MSQFGILGFYIPQEMSTSLGEVIMNETRTGDGVEEMECLSEESTPSSEGQNSFDIMKTLSG